VINGSAQRLPTEGGVEIIELGAIGAAHVVMTPSEGETQIQVGRFRQVAKGVQTPDGADIAVKL
jgi:hypothetical protein